MPRVKLDTSRVLYCFEQAREAVEVLESSEDPAVVAEAADVLRHAGQTMAIESIDVAADAAFLAAVLVR